MNKTFTRILQGYKEFRSQYAKGDNSIMAKLADKGQKPEIMIVACSDSRVDPALILQCEPGDLFMVRNVANIVPPYEPDSGYHGTSAALEFGICYLKVQHLIILGHSQCGGIRALMTEEELKQNDFITNWTSNLETCLENTTDVDEMSKIAIAKSVQNCSTFPWISKKVENNTLKIHQWFFDIKTAKMYSFCPENKEYLPLEEVGL